MKKLFIFLLTVLITASVYTYLTGASKRTDVPVISWKSDANPQRYEQIDMYHKFLQKNGVVKEDGSPRGQLVLDTASNQSTLIQAVSGMAGDIFDCFAVTDYAAMGVGVDVTEQANRNGYGLNTTYEGMWSQLSLGGRQYAYPCNGAVPALWVNVDTFKKYDLPVPPQEWTPEEFEELGKRFVKLANEGSRRQLCFFVPSVESSSFAMPILRSMGKDVYNETLTRSVANTPELARVLELLYKWTYEDRIAPTAADVASMNADSTGYGGANFSNFLQGRYAMIVTGRYGLIRFREFERQVTFSLSQLPMYDFKNLMITVRAAMPYGRTKSPELVDMFLRFLASYEYNKYIIDFADGLPPNPHIVEEDLKQLKVKYPREGITHELEIGWAQTIAIPDARPRYLKAGTPNWLGNSISEYFNGRKSAQEAAEYVEYRYNLEIDTACEANPATRADWEEQMHVQARIDEYKAAGKKIPVEWISNPFHIRYYRKMGMLVETTTAGAR